jgi:regulator of PEP synthase PpsR (kinase-PPPase family)
VINVTGKAVEETAATILKILDERGLLFEDPGESGQL